MSQFLRIFLPTLTLILYIIMKAHETACHSVSKASFISMKDKVKILLRLDVRFTKDSKVKDLFFGAPSSSEPSLVFKNYPFGMGFEPVKDNFQHRFVE